MPCHELENWIVDPDDVDIVADLPPEICKYILLYREGRNNLMQSEYIKHYGGPTAIAHHPKTGWALIGSGQGPFILWQQPQETSEPQPMW